MTNTNEKKQPYKPQKIQKSETNEPLKPDRVKAKIEIPDNRERRDGPGGS